jgi:hypothetical protein
MATTDLPTVELLTTKFALDYNSSNKPEKVPTDFVEGLLQYIAEKLPVDAVDKNSTETSSSLEKSSGEHETADNPETGNDDDAYADSETEHEQDDSPLVHNLETPLQSEDATVNHTVVTTVASPAPPDEAALIIYGPKPASYPPLHKPDSVLPLSLTSLSVAVSAWETALAHDNAARAVTKRLMNTPQSYSAQEVHAIKECSYLKTLFKFKGLMTPVNFQQFVRAMGQCLAFRNTYEGDVFGSAECFVSASCEDAASFSFDNELHYHTQVRELFAWNNHEQPLKSASASTRKTIAKPNDHSRIVLRRKPAPPGAIYEGREFLNLVLWKRISATKIAVFYYPAQHEDAPPSSDFVRAENYQYLSFTEIRPGVCHVQTFFHMNLNGNVPTVFTLYTAPLFTITAMKEVVTYFQHLVPIDEMTEMHGRDAGDLVMDRVLTMKNRTGWKHQISAINQELDVFFVRNAALRHMQDLHPWFKSMMRAVCEQRVVAPGVVKTRLADLSASEATRIGSFLKGEIIVGVDSCSAVDTWISSQVALVELDAQHKWFRSFMYSVALRVIKSSDLGMKSRVIFGAGLSLFDMASDIYMIYVFWTTDEIKLAIATLCMILASTALQVVLVLGATTKMKTSTKIFEIAIVLTCMKPAVDAFRVATDWQSDEHQTMDTLQEMVLSKCIESTAESIPASVLQGFAFLKAAKRSNAAIASIVISVATTSFTATIMTFDYDISPKKRLASPEFYGFIRSDARLRSLFLMYISTFAHVTCKVLACALVAVIDARVLMYYVAADTASAVLLKIVRKDFIYGSLKDSAFGAIASLIERSFNKIMIDFTGFYQGRHPCEQGGAYWAWCMIMTPVSALAAAWFYNKNSDVLQPEIKLSEKMVWMMVGGVAAVWFVTLVALIMGSDPAYWHTFYQTTTAKEFTVAVFRSAKTDERKALIFKRQFHVWRSIEGEVRTWVHGNIARWEKEKPEWYTKKLIQKIPEEVLTKEEIAMLISGGKKAGRRKSSIFEDVGLINTGEN